jgi:hypothetical protein
MVILTVCLQGSSAAAFGSVCSLRSLNKLALVRGDHRSCPSISAGIGRHSGDNATHLAKRSYIVQPTSIQRDPKDPRQHILTNPS